MAAAGGGRDEAAGAPQAPPLAAYTYLGYAGQAAATGGEGAIRKGLLALGVLAAVALLPRLVRRLRGGDPVAAELTATTLEEGLIRGEVDLALDVRDTKRLRHRSSTSSATRWR